MMSIRLRDREQAQAAGAIPIVHASSSLNQTSPVMQIQRQQHGKKSRDQASQETRAPHAAQATHTAPTEEEISKERTHQIDEYI